jgi:hypothetical protein
MYCKKCGKEIEDTAKFCDGCGEPQQDLPSSHNSEPVHAIMNDGKQILRKFFSKDPAAAIEEATGSQSKIGLVLIAITALLFALVSCLNSTQIINHIIRTVTSAITSTSNSLLGALGNAVTSSKIPDMQIPVLFSLFFPFLLFALVVAAVVLAAIYIIFKLKKEPCKSIYTVTNVIGVAGLPIAAALVVNLIIGFVLPQFTIFILLAAALIGLVTLYEGFKTLFAVEKAPVIEFAVLVFVICLVLAIASQIVISQLESMLQDTIMKAAGDGLKGLGGTLGGLFG